MTNTYSIGIDIGGTNTDIGLVSAEGHCVARKNLPTRQYFDADLYVSDICKKIYEMMADAWIQTKLRDKDDTEYKAVVSRYLRDHMDLIDKHPNTIWMQ